MSGAGSEVRLSAVSLRLGSHHFAFDLEVPSGRFAAITGASGAGKSTLFNLIAGFDEPTSGQLSIGGKNMKGLAPGQRPVSLVFQDNNLFAHLDIFTNVALGVTPSARLSKEQRTGVFTALKRVGLEGFEKRKPGTLSGGERQRAAFARALVRRKPVMLLDEPFAALDPGLRRQMGHMLKDLQVQEGFTVLMVTHDPAEVASLADIAVFIDAGRVAVSAPAKDFLDRREPSALARFLAAHHGGSIGSCESAP